MLKESELNGIPIKSNWSRSCGSPVALLPAANSIGRNKWRMMIFLLSKNSTNVLQTDHPEADWSD